MNVEQPLDWQDYCHRPGLPAARWLADPIGEQGPVGGVDVAVAIGPEGGMTPGEIESAQRAGWRLASLGPRVLRVETAALTMAIRATQ
jgi:16S rRNA (uracil1498-N3)-methyltransferase